MSKARVGDMLLLTARTSVWPFGQSPAPHQYEIENCVALIVGFSTDDQEHGNLPWVIAIAQGKIFEIFIDDDPSVMIINECD